MSHSCAAAATMQMAGRTPVRLPFLTAQRLIQAPCTEEHIERPDCTVAMQMCIRERCALLLRKNDRAC